MKGTLHVLQVEDSASDAALVTRALEKTGYAVHAEVVQNAQEMRAALKRQIWDVILSDHHLPLFDATAALFILHESGCDIPFLVVSGAIGEELAVEMMRSGAHDYVLKNNLARLGPAVEREVREARIRRETRDSEKKLREQDTLLREIHHRVKNNMQVVSSLLSLQARSVRDREIGRVLEDSQNRIFSMGLLHELLYRSEDLAAVDFPEYVRRLADHLFRSYGADRSRIRLETQLDHLAMELDDALPLGLLINEVVSNSLKHAFPDGRSGECSIRLRRESGNTISLVLSDNGIGFPQGVDWTTSRSLGLRLVRALTDQLRGTLEIQSQGGVEVRLSFPGHNPETGREGGSVTRKREAGAAPMGFETDGTEADLILK